MAQAETRALGHTDRMPRPLAAALLALLLAVPLRAQIVRVTGTLAPASQAPAITGLGSPLATTPSQPSPLPAAPLTPSLALAPLAPAPELRPVSLAALDVVIPAASRPGPPDRPRAAALAATPADGWASRFNFR